MDTTLDTTKGLEWGRLYEKYHGESYDPKQMSDDVNRLSGDAYYVTNSKGIFEYLLGGSIDTKLLAVRVFDDQVKRVAYAKQTKAAETKGESNCPLCTIGDNANKVRIYKFEEMDADHVAAWSKGGASSAKNCECFASRTIGPKAIDRCGATTAYLGARPYRLMSSWGTMSTK